MVAALLSIHSNLGGGWVVGEDLMFVLLLIGTLVLVDEASAFAVVDVMTLLLNAQLLFGGRTQLVHTLACCFRHTVQWFAGMCENLVGTFCNGLRNAFDLLRKTIWHIIQKEFPPKSIKSALNKRSDWGLPGWDCVKNIVIATKVVRECSVWDTYRRKGKGYSQ